MTPPQIAEAQQLARKWKPKTPLSPRRSFDLPDPALFRSNLIDEHPILAGYF